MARSFWEALGGMSPGAAQATNPVTGDVLTSQLDNMMATGLENQQETQDILTMGRDEAIASIQAGLGQAGGTLQPSIDQSQQYGTELNNLLMGQTPTSQIPGYGNMLEARRGAVGDLSTNMSGAGKFFSGTTAARAGDIGSNLETQLIQQRIQNLMMGARPGQEAQSQLAGLQMGGGLAEGQAQTSMGTNIAGIMSQNQAMANAAAQQNAEQEAGFWSDAIGGAASALGSIWGSGGDDE